MTQRQSLAWTLVKRRLQMTTRGWPERLHQRDVVGTVLADWVALVRIALIALTDRPSGQTEIERRAVVCARNRLKTKAKARATAT